MAGVDLGADDALFRRGGLVRVARFPEKKCRLGIPLCPDPRHRHLGMDRPAFLFLTGRGAGYTGSAAGLDGGLHLHRLPCRGRSWCLRESIGRRHRADTWREPVGDLAADDRPFVLAGFSSWGNEGHPGIFRPLWLLCLFPDPVRAPSGRCGFAWWFPFRNTTLFACSRYWRPCRGGFDEIPGRSDRRRLWASCSRIRQHSHRETRGETVVRSRRDLDSAFAHRVCGSIFWCPGRG